MAQPTPYTRQFDFSDFQTVNPARPLPGSELDAELDRVKLTSDQTLANLAKIQRDDGRLNNQSVTPESLSAATLALIAQGEYNPRGFWAAATAYAVGDLVEFNAATFLALVAHTSDTQFTTDQTAGRWLLIANGALQGGGQAIDLLEGDGTETVFNLSFNYNGDEAATVFVGGVAQIPGQDFTIVGDTLTFVSAPPAPVVPGRKNVMVRGTGLEAQLAADNATAAANNAANSATAAQNSATAASNSASAALASENAASASEAASATSEGNAATSASNAATSATNASNSAAAALASENAAAGSASAAATSEGSAAASATTATNQATTATNQATAASNSASAAATSATNASNSASNASGSATVATQQATIATNAATAAGGSESNAAASASQAATSASNASASASSASSSASSANTSAVNAASSATSASNSATAAGNSAAAALASQNAAATSESNAAASATAANQSKIDTEQVAERYQGDKASAPTLRNNGNPLQAGDLYFDTVLNEMRVYDGSIWKSAGSTVNGTAVRQSFTATAGQTTFTVTGGYDAGFADVYLNGVKLVNGVDVNVTSGTDVVLTVGAAAGDSVDVIAYGAFVLANHYTRAEADAAFVEKTSATGAALMPVGTTAQRPASPAIGMVRFNTDFDALENFTADGWLKVSIEIPTLTAVDGTIFSGAASTLTLTGTRFGIGAGTVRFTSGATVANVTVTPASPTSATVTVPSAIFNLSAGVSVDVQFINTDNGVSNAISKTTAGLPTGGTITTAGGFRIHTFTSSGSLVVPSGFSASAQYLVIAGGGGGGGSIINSENPEGGGGGAGGYRCSVVGESSGGGASAESTISLTAGTYTATIGAGGAGGATQTQAGENGSNTVFSTITATGGGGGGARNAVAKSGGSGGGGAPFSDVSGTGGSGTSGQGYAGGNGIVFDQRGGGGGGAGGTGANATSGAGGNGGSGVSSSINGTATGRAGGGGGASGGTATAGGGNGGGNGGANAQSGTVNTGGGGGGQARLNSVGAGNGGSGIVIIRYALP
jgi:hypothetical protein